MPQRQDSAGAKCNGAPPQARVFLSGCQDARVTDARVFVSGWQMPGYRCPGDICPGAKCDQEPTPGLGAADKGTMVIIPLSPGSTQPAVYTIRTRLGGPYPRSFPFDFTIGWLSLG